MLLWIKVMPMEIADILLQTWQRISSAESDLSIENTTFWLKRAGKDVKYYQYNIFL